MIVNYFGVTGCDCKWSQNGAFLVAPSSAPVPVLQQAGFYYAQDGSWYKQLSPQEASYLQSLGNQGVVNLPAAAPNNYVPPVGAQPMQQETPEEKRKANKMCWISVILMYGPASLRYLLAKIMSASTYLQMYETLGTLAAASALAAFILMIVVRVKYPKNTFGKVLMIIYLVQIALAILAILVFAAMCNSALRGCGGR